MKRIFFLLLLAAVAPAAALELSLEENKGESGTVGYVDIDRVFKDYSGTLNAREEFLGEIREKEESVNLRRHAIYSLKADIAKLKQEREFALTLPSLLATREQLRAPVPTQPAVSTQAVAPAEVPVSTEAAPSASPTGSTAPVSAPSAAMPAAPLTQTPAAAAVPVSTAAPDYSSFTPRPQPPPAAPAAVPNVPISSLPGLGIDMPGVAKVPIDYFKFSVSTAVPEIDAAVSAKETELKQKEDSLRLYQRQVEKELLEYESHRSEILLGRIYVALKELAVREGVSVIIDKRNILFGHLAVDLTDKLLAKLEEEQ